MIPAQWELLAAVALDLLLGDPRWFPHPIRGLGWTISRLEQFWRWTQLPLRLAGVGLLVCTMLVACLSVWATLPWLAIFWIWTLLAIRDLDVEAMAVIRALELNDIPRARNLVARIVGRDTDRLDEPEMVRAVVETVAENLSDAIIAPLLFLALGGPVAMAAYKAVNTLDSMVGYRSAEYREFGWASARLDDVLNFIPARLSAALVWIAAGITGLRVRESVRISLRDAASQPSPNAGWPEAAFAGALGVRLGGTNSYRGVGSRKPTLGDPDRPLSVERYRECRRLLYVTSALMVGMVAVAMAISGSPGR